MFSLVVENERGEQLELTHNDDYAVSNVQGLAPPTATINTKTVTNFDGARFNSSRVEMRNLVITVLPSDPIDENRIALYQFIKVKQFIRIYYKNRLRNVCIDGYVESMDDDFFTSKQAIQISILCPNPYFRSVDDAIDSFTDIVDLFEIPFSIPEEGMPVSEMLSEYKIDAVNDGDVETGVIFRGEFVDNVVELSIIRINSIEYMTLEYEFLKGDKLVINTNKGSKSIMLYRGTKQINLINYLESGSTWLELNVGNNRFEYRTIYGKQNVVLTAEHTNLFEGV